MIGLQTPEGLSGEATNMIFPTMAANDANRLQLQLFSYAHVFYCTLREHAVTTS